MYHIQYGIMIAKHLHWHYPKTSFVERREKLNQYITENKFIKMNIVNQDLYWIEIKVKTKDEALRIRKQTDSFLNTLSSVEHWFRSTGDKS